MNNNIDEQIKETMERTEAKYRANLGKEAPEKNKSAGAIMDLTERGYPARHIKKVESMIGPSFDRAKTFLPRVIGEDCLILLIGDRGPGKTQMATWWAFQRGLAGKSVGLYRKTADLIGEIKSTWGNQKRDEEDVLRKYRTIPFLVLDEWNEKGASDWESRVLVNILDHRYDAERVTIIIGNIDAAQAKDAFHPSILSRAEETGGLVLCDWKSYRA